MCKNGIFSQFYNINEIFQKYLSKRRSIIFSDLSKFSQTFVCDRRIFVILFLSILNTGSAFNLLSISVVPFFTSFY